MIRLASLADEEAAWKIIGEARKYMASYNSPQWQGVYPTEDVIIKDISTKSMYVLDIDGDIAGIIVLKKEFTKNYVAIEGQWEYPVSDDDLVIHRLAISDKYRGNGLGKKMLTFAIDYAKEHHLYHIKSDTHPLNLPMQKSLEGVGFKKVGIVYSMLEQSDKTRYAYELLIK